MQRHRYVILVAGLLIGSALPSPAAAQSTAAPDLATAQRQLMQQKFDSAAAVLTALVEREPDHAQAWALLGMARRRAGDLDGALAAQRRATQFQATAPRALLDVGLVWAAKGHADSAFVWLGRAKATGRIDMSAIEMDPSAALLHADPRYRALYPTDAEFAHPFVEDATIIREWRGGAAGDQFGWIARDIGDVNDDGIRDVVTSAPSAGGGAGKVYAYDARTGAELWAHPGEEGAALGTGLESAGDVNRDGVADVIAGAPGAERALVLSGRDGSVLLDIAAPRANEGFGRAATGVADANGDGHADIAVGAPGPQGPPGASTAAGRVHLFSGRDGSLLRTLEGRNAGDGFGSAVAGGTIAGSAAVVVGEPGPPGAFGGRVRVFDASSGEERFVIDGDDSAVQLGFMFVSVVGDVDGDGVQDVWATDFADATAGPSTGRAYVHSGSDGRRLHTFGGEGAGQGFGIGSAEAGDIDGDGHDDIVVGAWQHAGAAASGGRVYVYSGRDGTLMRTITGQVPGETLGFDATGIGDVDGDGIPDLLLTSAWSAVNGARSGRVYIVAGTRADLP